MALLVLFLRSPESQPASVPGRLLPPLLVLLVAAGPFALFARRGRGEAVLPPSEPASPPDAVSARAHHGEDEAVRLQTVLDHLPMSFLLLDRDRRILAASADFEALTSRRLSEVGGRTCSPGLWSGRICGDCTSRRALRSRRPESAVARVERDDGSAGFFEHVSVPVTRDGEAHMVLEIVTDITDREILREHMARAEKLAVVGEVASGIAHEMRNALTSVKMILQLLIESAAENDVDEESVRIALGSVQHSESVVSQLLQFARPSPLRRSPCDVAPLLEETARLMRHDLERRTVALELDIADGLPLLWADAERLKTAILNLLLNASQAVGPGDRVILRVRRARLEAAARDVLRVRRPIPPGAREDPERDSGVPRREFAPAPRQIVLPRRTEVVLFEVEDTGLGIPDDRLDRVFDPFYTTKANGTGLGLPLTQHIVNEHGGVVTVRNLNPGCLFTMVLPLASAEVASR